MSVSTPSPSVSPSLVNSSGVILKATLLPTNDDFAGAWRTFAPAAGNLNKNNADWNWKLSMTFTKTAKEVRRITLIHNTRGEIWSTGYGRYLADGTDLYGYEEHPYPLVLRSEKVGPGSGSWYQINTYYDQALLMGGPTASVNVENIYYLYGQRESSIFTGGKLIVEFADGTSVSASVPIAPVNALSTPSPVPTSTPTPPSSPVMIPISLTSPHTGDKWFVGNSYRVIWNDYTSPTATYVYMTGGGNASTYRKSIGVVPRGINYLDHLVTSSDMPLITGASWNVIACMGEYANYATNCSWAGPVYVQANQAAIRIDQPATGFNYLANIGKNFSQVLVADASVDWSLAQGNLPQGLSLSKYGAFSGQISGIPTQTGTFTFAVKATDVSNISRTNTIWVTVTVNPSPTASPVSSPTPSPVASLTANGLKELTLNVGSSVQYSWTSQNADSYTSMFTSNNPSLCGSGNWLAFTANGSATTNIASNYAGCRWTVSYTVKNSNSGQAATDVINVKVNPISTSPSPSVSPVSVAPDQDQLSASIWDAMKEYFDGLGL